MYRIKVLTVGKTKEAWLDQGIEEYITRLKKILHFEWILAKNDAQLEQFLEKETTYICLDPRGKSLTSEKFSELFIKQLEKEGSRLSFVIGGAEGLSEKMKKRASLLISLSPLTFTHQLTRLILVEQIYRALEIDRGSPYHK